MFKFKTRDITALAMLCALAYLVMFATHALPPVIAFPPLRYDPKDIVIIIGGFLYGPLAVILMSVVVSFIEMFTVSTTSWIGFVMNVLSTCTFGCAAVIIYRRFKTVYGAAFGLSAGVLCATVVMLLWNYIMTPIFLADADVSAAVWRERVFRGMLLQIFLPFNMVKGGINAAAILILYRPIVQALRLSNLLPKQEENPQAKPRINIGVTAFAGFVLVTFFLFVMVLQGRL
jgi:riboflavin transporter FmnP